jgi:hypothetical protein
MQDLPPGVQFTFDDDSGSHGLDLDSESISSVVAGMILTSLHFTVPLDWDAPHSSESISIFVRKVVSVAHEKLNLPYLLYLQGGPGTISKNVLMGTGFPSPR